MDLQCIDQFEAFFQYSFTKQQFEEMARQGTFLTLKPEELVFEEGEWGDCVFFLLQGHLEVSRNIYVDRYSKRIVLAQLQSGEIFGEGSIWGSGVRNARVQAIEHSVLWSLPSRYFLEAPAQRFYPFYRLLLSSVLDKVRTSDQRMLDAVQHSIQTSMQTRMYGLFLLYTFFGIALQRSVEFFFQSAPHGAMSFGSTLFSIIVMCILLFALFFVIDRKMVEQMFDWRETQGLRKICEGLVISVAAVPMSLYLFVLPEDFDLLYFWQHVVFHNSMIFSFLYFVSSFLQEFLLRVVFQQSIQKFLNYESPMMAVLFSSFLFISIHLRYSLDTIMLFALANLLWGSLYAWRKSLVINTIVHYCMGISYFYVFSVYGS